MNFKPEVLVNAFVELTKALPRTLLIAFIAMTIGLILGTIIGILRQTKLNKMLGIWVSFFRGTPLMIQLFLFFFGLPQLFPIIGKLSAFQSAVLVMGINASAYVAESIRGALGAVDSLQSDAAYTVGLTKLQTLWYIVLPQAMKIALPSLGNTFIGVIQGTSLTFMLGISDLLGLAKMRAAQNYRFFEVYLAVGIWYWLIVMAVTFINRQIESKMAAGKESI